MFLAVRFTAISTSSFPFSGDFFIVLNVFQILDGRHAWCRSWKILQRLYDIKTDPLCSTFFEAEAPVCVCSPWCFKDEAPVCGSSQSKHSARPFGLYTAQGFAVWEACTSRAARTCACGGHTRTTTAERKCDSRGDWSKRARTACCDSCVDVVPIASSISATVLTGACWVSSGCPPLPSFGWALQKREMACTGIWDNRSLCVEATGMCSLACTSLHHPSTCAVGLAVQALL